MMGDVFRVSYNWWNVEESAGRGLSNEENLIDMMGFAVKGENKWYVP